MKHILFSFSFCLSIFSSYCQEEIRVDDYGFVQNDIDYENLPDSLTIEQSIFPLDIEFYNNTKTIFDLLNQLDGKTSIEYTKVDEKHRHRYAFFIRKDGFLSFRYEKYDLIPSYDDPFGGGTYKKWVSNLDIAEIIINKPGESESLLFTAKSIGRVKSSRTKHYKPVYYTIDIKVKDLTIIE